MKILTICEGGNNRSQGLARVLKVEHGHNAIAVGMNHVFKEADGFEPGNFLCRWAELIVVMSEKFYPRMPLPREAYPKVKICEVGDDTYGYPTHPELLDKCRAWIKQEGL